MGGFCASVGMMLVHSGAMQTSPVSTSDRLAPPVPSAMRQILCRNVTRNTGSVGQSDPAPDPAIGGHAVSSSEARSVWQADDDIMVKPRTVAKLQKIIGAGTCDHCTGTDRASSDANQRKKNSKMLSHFHS